MSLFFRIDRKKFDDCDDHVFRAILKIKICDENFFRDKDAYSYVIFFHFFKVWINQYVIVFERMMRCVCVIVFSRFLHNYYVEAFDFWVFEACCYYNVFEFVYVVLKYEQLFVYNLNVCDLNIYDVFFFFGFFFRGTFAIEIIVVSFVSNLLSLFEKCKSKKIAKE